MDKRKKVKLLSVVMGVILLLSRGLGLQDGSLVALLAASIAYFGLYWVLEFNIIGFRLIFVFTLPVLFDFVFIQQSLRLEEIVGGEVREIVYIIAAIAFGILNYVILLTANILNVASIKKIPLLQVAQTSLYFFTILLAFLGLLSIQSLEYSTLLEIVMVFMFGFVLFYQLLWFILNERSVLFYISVLCALLSAFIYGTLSYLPISNILLNTVVSVFVYVFAGIIMHTAKKSFSGVVLSEYLFTVSVFLAIVFASADWGSFGALF